MRKLPVALAALLLSAPAVAAAQDVAPPVKRKPVAASPAPRPGAPVGREREFQAALSATSTQSGSDPALDTSLIRVMSRLMAAGRCGEATGLATRDGRKELASKAQQLCR